MLCHIVAKATADPMPIDPHRIDFRSCFWCSFNVPQKGCGTRSQLGAAAAAAAAAGPGANQLAFQRSLDVGQAELFLENTVIIQHDPDLQEAGDTARRLRCVWRNSLQKSVNAKLRPTQPSLVS